jgi:hypothetical protein
MEDSDDETVVNSGVEMFGEPAGTSSGRTAEEADEKTVSEGKNDVEMVELPLGLPGLDAETRRS